MKQVSFVASPKKLKRSWYLIDASDVILGRLATRVATILMGKHKPTYTSFLDTGDFVIVTNAEKIKLTGKKLTKRVFKSYSGYLGGQKTTSLKTLFQNRPEEVIREAVRLMLPKTILGKSMLRKLKVYKGSDHPHQAQTPIKLDPTKIRRGRIWLGNTSGQLADEKAQ